MDSNTLDSFVQAGMAAEQAAAEVIKKAAVTLPQTSPSGAYIEAGPRPFQLYASISRSLVAVLELDEDCPGRVFTYFMRGGIAEGAMSVMEYQRGTLAMIDLLVIAQLKWPKKLREVKDA